MNGPRTEGIYRDGDAWVRVEYRHYPLRRWVIRRMTFERGRLDYADTSTPELTPSRWALLRSALTPQA